MSDSQKFPVAAHALAYLAHKKALAPAQAVSSAELAISMPTNPVVVRRVTAMLAKAGLIATRAGVNGGAWLLKPAERIGLDEVLHAVNGCAHLGRLTKGAEGCPVGERIPKAVGRAIEAADKAAAQRLASISVADLLAEA
jgi:DNA-binding IscR family transcriptional regulator